MDPIEFTICQFHMKVIDTKLHVHIFERENYDDLAVKAVTGSYENY